MFLDERIFELTQEVCDNGLTYDLQRVVVVQDAESIGILHLGDI